MFATRTFLRHGHPTVAALAALAFSTQSLPLQEQQQHRTRLEAGETSPAVDNEKLFENQCLERQLFQPRLPYPAWDYNWDGKETPETSLEGVRQGLNRQVHGKIRHVILVRHGQYEESPSDDHRRQLTPLGRLQAIRTGKRLKEMVEGCDHFAQERFRGPCRVTAAIHVSNMTRAKETAELIAQEMGLSLATPDPDLNEAIPAPMMPIRPDIPGATEEIDEHHERIERAFERYIYRDNSASSYSGEESEIDDDDNHEFEIIVCHGEYLSFELAREILWELPRDDRLSKLAARTKNRLTNLI